jgi:hypothetical protein
MNRAPRLTDADLGYLAGIIDGEGHIGLVRRRRSNWKNHPEQTHVLRPVLQIGQARRELLDHIARVVGEGSVGAHGQRGFYNLRFFPNTMRWLLPELLPHLVLKKRQAEIVIEFMSKAGVEYNGRQLPEDELARRRALGDEIKRLNTPPSRLRRAAGG